MLTFMYELRVNRKQCKLYRSGEKKMKYYLVPEDSKDYDLLPNEVEKMNIKNYQVSSSFVCFLINNQ